MQTVQKGPEEADEEVSPTSAKLLNSPQKCPTTPANSSKKKPASRLLFPNDFEAALAILDDYGSESYHLWKESVQIGVLKLSIGNLQRLANFMETARGDYRDIFVVAYNPNGFRVSMAGKSTMEDLRQAEEQDEWELQRWLDGNAWNICETCIGVGIIPNTPRWTTCPTCHGHRWQNTQLQTCENYNGVGILPDLEDLIAQKRTFPQWTTCPLCQGQGRLY